MAPTKIISNESQHVAVFAFPFGSHPITLLNLVRRLAKEAPRVRFSLFNTKISNNSLFQASKINNSSNLPSNINAYDVEDGVPIGHVFSSTNPVEAVDLFYKASPNNFEKGMEISMAETGSKITCLLFDAFSSNFSSVIASKLQVPWIPIWLSLPCSFYAHLFTDVIRQKYFTSTGTVSDSERALDFIPGLSAMKFSDLPKEIISEDFPDSSFIKALSEVGNLLAPSPCTALVLNSFAELNPPDLNQDLETKFKKVLNVGFLTLELSSPLPVGSDKTGYISWLDGQRANSVAYVSFGSVVALPIDELKAVAEVLIKSEIPFIWSLKDHFKNLLPIGFFEKTKYQGKVVSWTPQTQVLAHESVGVFLTHCGCNSVYESIASGVPMICRPFFGDHHMTGRMVESIWGIGVKIEGGIITETGLLHSLQLILEKEEGKKMKERALALKELLLKAADSSATCHVPPKLSLKIQILAA